jgi:IMP dehydrogenase/GMP reductase
MSYLGAHTLPELVERAKFVRITEAGLRESLPHALESL